MWFWRFPLRVAPENLLGVVKLLKVTRKLPNFSYIFILARRREIGGFPRENRDIIKELINDYQQTIHTVLLLSKNFVVAFFPKTPANVRRNKLPKFLD